MTEQNRVSSRENHLHMTLECTSVSTGTDVSAPLGAASGIVAPIIDVFNPCQIVMFLAGERQAELSLNPALLSEAIPDFCPQLVGSLVGAEQVVHVPKQVETSTRAADCNDCAVLVFQESSRARFAVSGTANKGEEDDIIFLTLV